MSERDGLRPGLPFPLGARWDGAGTNFAVFSEHASAVELCLFDEYEISSERRRIRLGEATGSVWHGYLHGVGPRTPYGYRLHGPYRPEDGHRFNAAKLLLDPYARAIAGTVDWNAPVYGYRRGRDATDSKPDRRDDAAGVPKSIIVDPAFDWGDDQRPRTPWARTVIYELHVKGFTQLHPRVPSELRGSYVGLGHPAAIDHLQRLGVTAVELLPIHAFVDDDFLVRRGLRQYWGYNSLGFFAPEGRYSASGDRGEQVAEFKAMVKALHAAGIEVILDVVYNHTGEGGRLGPTLAFRGLDNLVYYRLQPGDRSRYEDVTGTGNTLNVAHPQVLKLVMDSLRYWVDEMHVDGFRFDLGPAMARGESSFESTATFFRAIFQDPSLSTVKLIAEPWDLGEHGYRLGEFPREWREWNDRFRDSVRRFWSGGRGSLGDLGFRLTGSSDIFDRGGRGPLSGINFVTAHDGFTLRDVVSYERKHNLANGELNRDGSDHNHSWNNGVEGPTDEPAIRAVRRRQIKNMIATLLAAHGVPMLLAGDELGRTQGGNNNAYCQDNPISWIDWRLDGDSEEILEFARQAIALRRSHPALRLSSFARGTIVPGGRLPDIAWYRPDGRLMTMSDWRDPECHAFAYRLVHRSPTECDGVAPVRQLFVALNASTAVTRFRLPRPGAPFPAVWHCALTTADGLQPRRIGPGRTIVLQDRSLAVFELCDPPA